MITNASFRTKKLPDDITVAANETEAPTGPLQPHQGPTSTSPSAFQTLGPISEENDEQPSTKTFRLPELSQLVKKKDKSKQADSSKASKPASSGSKSVKKSNAGNGDPPSFANGDNGPTIVLNSATDWSYEADKEDMESHRRTEFHVSTQV